MARWLWIFWIYSFLGYGLEKLFAAVTHAPNQGRKCFLLLPLCPVYGLGMLAVLALPPVCRGGEPLAEANRRQVTLACELGCTADAACSARFLRQTHDIEALRWAVHTTWNR